MRREESPKYGVSTAVGDGASTVAGYVAHSDSAEENPQAEKSSEVSDSEVRRTA